MAHKKEHHEEHEKKEHYKKEHHKMATKAKIATHAHHKAKKK